MKTIKIFLASSEELKPEREMMASLANSLNTALESQATQVIVVEWENLDASMGVLHKQEDYNNKLRDCDMCIVLYWTKFGMYTKTELDIAYNELKAGNNPKKLYVYFKGGAEPCDELKEFRDSFPVKYGHFFTSFENIDTLKAHFLLQFMEYQSQTLQNNKAIELKNGKVLIGGEEYINLRNVPFAGNNEEYNLIQNNIKKTQKLLSVTSPEDPDYEEYDKDLREMKEKLAKMESSLWDMALMITRLSADKCSERLQRAMDCFNKGDNKAAASILKEDDIYNDAQQNINLVKLGREGLLVNIDELLLKIKLLTPTVYYQKVVDTAYEKISAILTNVIEYASIAYGEYSKEVLKYCIHSKMYFEEQPKRRLQFLERAMEIAKRICCDDEIDEIISIYRDIAWAYEEHDFMDYDVRIQCKYSVVELIHKKYGEQSEKYIDAVVYYEEVLYWKDPIGSKRWFEKALSICRSTQNVEKEKQILRRKITELSTISRDWEWIETLMARYKDLSAKEEILCTYLEMAHWTINNEMTKKYYEEALIYATKLNDDEAKERVFGGLSRVYGELKDFDKQIEYLKRSIEISGSECSWVTYVALADAYLHKGDYSAVIECAYKYLDKVPEKRCSLGIICLYNRLCLAYKNLKDYDTAAECLLKAIDSDKQNIACYVNLAKFYSSTSQADKALNVYLSLIENEELVCCDSEKAEILGKMGWVYYLLEDLSNAEQCYKDSIGLYLQDRPNKKYAKQADINRSNRSIAEAYENIAKFYALNGEYAKAQEALNKSCDFQRKRDGRIIWQGIVCRGNGEYQKAIDIFESEQKIIGEKESQTEIAFTLLEWDKPTEALEIAQKVASEHSDYMYVHKVLGCIYKKLNYIERAMAEFKTCLALMEEDHSPSLAIKEVKGLMETL